MLKSKLITSKKIKLQIVEKTNLVNFYNSKKLSAKLQILLSIIETEVNKSIKFSPKKIEVSLEFTSNYQIKKINYQFRNKNKITDVLSFPLNHDLRFKRNLMTASDPIQLGDILICIPRAKIQAKKFNVTIEDEIIHLFVHGFLHLVGFDHEISRSEEMKMQNLEDLIISKLIKKRGP